MDDFDFTVPNLAAYEQHLLSMGTKVARAVGRKAVRQGANIILHEARALVQAGHPQFPNKITGRLARSLRVRDYGIRGDTITFQINVGKYAFYGRFVEFGTYRTKAYPFMRVAAEKKARAAVVKMSETLRTGIESQWRQTSWA